MALEDEPDFVGVMNNVTVVRGRDAIFSCSVSPWDDEEFTVNYFLQIKLTFDPIIFEFKKQFQIGWVKVDDLSKVFRVEKVDGTQAFVEFYSEDISKKDGNAKEIDSQILEKILQVIKNPLHTELC